jgi:hypothetical protein
MFANGGEEEFVNHKIEPQPHNKHPTKIQRKPTPPKEIFSGFSLISLNFITTALHCLLPLLPLLFHLLFECQRRGSLLTFKSSKRRGHVLTLSTHQK